MTAPDLERTGDRPAVPQGLFSYHPDKTGHSCGDIAPREKDDPLLDGKCVKCPACTPFRLRHTVHRPDGTTHLVLRCSHCDGPDAHHTLKEAA